MTQDNENNIELVQYCTFYLGDCLCGVDISLVQEINDDLTITKVPLAPEFVMGIMNLRGQIVTIIDQGSKLGYKSTGPKEDKRIIIIKSQDEHIGLLVDRVTEVSSVTKADVGPPPPNVKGIQGTYFSGIVRTNYHELLAVLNVEKLLEDAFVEVASK